ncbi:hypothetical protein [Legionella quateirensis]|uniref:Avirulence protein AvrBs3 n=1 Tax=Legionella quateirensis TaxID=45072 RepID=A0A378KY89_9GAMM|nr:hypothetical protein [Legionella quateirensis]KTD48332.1 hypothetical protein Lqua_1861 [Legionella quateirensis]STY18338.1 Uncharacterised protein [Legionella quateirensis]
MINDDDFPYFSLSDDEEQMPNVPGSLITPGCLNDSPLVPYDVDVDMTLSSEFDFSGHGQSLSLDLPEITLSGDLEDYVQASNTLTFLGLQNPPLLLPDVAPLTPVTGLLDNPGSNSEGYFSDGYKPISTESVLNTSSAFKMSSKNLDGWTEYKFHKSDSRESKRVVRSEEATASCSSTSSASVAKIQRTSSGKKATSKVRSGGSAFTWVLPKQAHASAFSRSAGSMSQRSSLTLARPSSQLDDVFPSSASVVPDHQQNLPVDSPDMIILPSVTHLLSGSAPILDGPVLRRYKRTLTEDLLKTPLASSARIEKPDGDDILQPDNPSQQCMQRAVRGEVSAASSSFRVHRSVDTNNHFWSERNTISLASGYAKCGFPGDTYIRYYKALEQLGYKEESIHSLFLGAGQHGGVEALIRMHNTLIGLVKDNGLGHKDLIKACACPEGVKNLQALMDHYTTLRARGYLTWDIIHMVSRRNGSLTLESVRAKHDELIGMGLQIRDIVCIAFQHHGARRLELVAEFFRTVSEVIIPTKQIVELVTESEVEELFQVLKTKQERLEEEQKEAVQNTAHPLMESVPQQSVLLQVPASARAPTFFAGSSSQSRLSALASPTPHPPYDVLPIVSRAGEYVIFSFK